MLPAATVHLIDRLVAALMNLVEAVAPSLAPRINATLPAAAAHTLLFRLTNLVVYLIDISNVGVRPRSKPEPTPQAPNPPAPSAQATQPAPSLPRRRGWLLAALPELAPPIAAEIGTLLADPAIAHLLDLAPSLRTKLRPLLRALGLTAPAPTPTPPPPIVDHQPPGAPPPTPTAPPPPNPPPPTPTSKRALATPNPFHAQFIPIP